MDEFTEKILKPSGRENLIQSIWNAAKGLMSVIAPLLGRRSETSSAYDFRTAIRFYRSVKKSHGKNETKRNDF